MDDEAIAGIFPHKMSVLFHNSISYSVPRLKECFRYRASQACTDLGITMGLKRNSDGFDMYFMNGGDYNVIMDAAMPHVMALAREIQDDEEAGRKRAFLNAVDLILEPDPDPRMRQAQIQSIRKQAVELGVADQIDLDRFVNYDPNKDTHHEQEAQARLDTRNANMAFYLSR